MFRFGNCTFLMYSDSAAWLECSASFSKIDVNYRNTFDGAVAQMDRAEVS
jgi:hypothetical protein